MGVVTFNNKASTGIFNVSTPPDYEIAEKLYERVSVPGRNGELLIDTGSYGNVDRVYEISYGSEGGDYAALSKKVSEFFNSGIGYLRLEDTYEPDHFFMASFKGPVNITNILAQAGKATITFDRKPERFLKTGANVITVTNPAPITNPTNQYSKPIIKVFGSGACSITINGYKVSFASISAYVVVDSDIEDVYKDAINMNAATTLDKGFPLLRPGSNTISYTGSITKLEITPRWWIV